MEGETPANLPLAHEASAVSPHSSQVAQEPASQVSSTVRMPKVTSFDLPLADLQQVALSSGLEWINSNPERVAQIQAAIAAEPRPVHVPRQRPAPVAWDEGPLILVETKRDLSQLAMPFEEDGAH
jgi:ribonuclease E